MATARRPAILRAIENHQRALDARGARTASALTRRYAIAWRAIEKDLEKLTERMTKAVAAGETLSPAWLVQEVRYRALLTQIEEQINEFSQYAYKSVRAECADVLQLAQTHAGAIAANAPRGAAALASFTRLPTEVVAAISGAVGPYSPLQQVFATLGATTRARVADLLVSGVVLGRNPRTIARDIQRATGAPLSRCLTIARTESLRAYREASRASYQRSGVSSGWVWYSALDRRGCIACWAQHGTIHPLNEPMAAHPNCRCTMLPVVDGWTPPVPTGAEVFERLSDAEQQALLGPSKYRAYKDGAVSLADLVKLHNHPTWGPSVQERSLVSALGDAGRAAGYYRPEADS